MLLKETVAPSCVRKIPLRALRVWNVRATKVELFFRIRAIVLSFYPFLNSNEKFTIFQKQCASTVSRTTVETVWLRRALILVSQNSALLVCHWGTHNLPFISLVDIINLFFNLTNSRVMDMHYNHRKEKKMLAHRKSKHLSWSFDKICGLISEGKRCNLYFFSLISEFWKHKVKRVNTDRDRRRIFSCPFLNCLQL